MKIRDILLCLALLSAIEVLKFILAKMKSYCSNCNRQTNQNVVEEVAIKNSEPETGWWDETHYQIIQCAGCDELSFRKLYNDISWQQPYDEDTTEQELYPDRGPHSRPMQKYRGLPQKIYSIYKETINSFNSKSAVLSGVGIRAIIEAICLDKNITQGKVTGTDGKVRTSKQLDGKIAGLAEQGLLTPDNAEILHELRFLGNEAVHNLYEPPLSELSLAIDIVELVIENIYMIRRKAGSLRDSRETRKK